MNHAAPTPTLFADAIEIPQWLERDRETPYAERLHRDRAIAGTLTGADPLSRVRAWWHHDLRTHAQPVAPDAPVACRLERGRRLIALLMVVAGVIAGVTAASAVFHYDGTWPVNVVTVLATLVLLQLFLIALTLLLMLPRLPGLAALQDLLGSVNPGAIVAALYRRARRSDDGMEVFEWQGARGPAAARFARWQVLAWSQLAAVAFNVAVLVTAAGLIAFTDLAFGWSTTLQMSSGEALRIAEALSAPWRHFWPEAVPHAALIEESRFFRLASAQPASMPAAALTGWWPFLLAAIVTYALVPRLLLLGLASFRLRAATRGLLMDDPRVKALLDRMESAQIELGPSETEPPMADAACSPGATPAPRTNMPAVAIVWSAALPVDAVQDWAAAHLQWNVMQIHEAGGARALINDQSVIERLASSKPAAVLILVRAWEAPLLDLRDFLALLRTQLDTGASLIVVPVGAAGASATEAQRMTWSRWTARIADPALYLETGS